MDWGNKPQFEPSGPQKIYASQYFIDKVRSKLIDRGLDTEEAVDKFIEDTFIAYEPMED